MGAHPIVIAGAGIGGLTTALALAARNIPSVILEKSAELAAVGAGVQLSPNASRILIGLGLADALDAHAARPVCVVLNSVRAQGEVARLPLAQTTDAPYWVIHRAALQTTLRAAVEAHPAITLRLGSAVEDFSQQDGTVAVVFGDETIAAAALIGADGVGSRIRQRLVPDSAPHPQGISAWRGMAQGAASRDVDLWMAGGAHLVAYPVDGGARANLVVTLPDGAEAHADRAGRSIAEQLAQAGWPGPPCDLIASAGVMTRYPLRTVQPPASWTVGRVALLGDAAHAMLPFAAQGAAMAIEDAAVLARCFDTNAVDIPAALARYGEARRARVIRVAAAARQSGRIYHLRGPMAFARDAAIRLLGAQRLLARQAWIYDWRI